jgi:hypothetical protein
VSLVDRQRPHEQHHQRTLEQQILDALLRIEELLIAKQQKTEETEVKKPTPVKLEAKPSRKVDRL